VAIDYTKNNIIKNVYLFIYFGGTGILTQGFTLARQVLYHLSHSASPKNVYC
jgi:hypothetical protein